MIIHDINQTANQVILCIHPLFMNANIMQEVFKPNPNYRYLFIDLAKHGDAYDQPFLTIQQETNQLLTYLNNHNIQRIHLAYAADRSCNIIFQLLNDSSVQIDSIYLEGCSFYTNATFLNATIKHKLKEKHNTAIHNIDYIKQNGAKYYGSKYANTMVDTFTRFTLNDLNQISYDLTHVNLPKHINIPALFSYGEKDLLLSKAKSTIQKQYPNAIIKQWPNQNHATTLTTNPTAYIQSIQTFMNSL